jgi:hypothetical protein
MQGAIRNLVTQREHKQMVDKEYRQVAAKLIEQFVSCRITNFQFRDRFPKSEDKALRAIETRLWFAYDDLCEHRLDGKHAPSEAWRVVFQRCVLFLRAEFEYTGPDTFIKMTAPFKRLRNFALRTKETSSLLAVWPFDSEEQLELASRTL